MRHFHRTFPKCLSAFLLCFALLVGILPAGALATDIEPAEGTNECICEALCTGGSVNADCPVCGTAGADLIQCAGTEIPDAGEITEDNAEKVKAQLETIDEAKAQLSDEELDRLDVTRYLAAAEALGALAGSGQALKLRMPQAMFFTSNADRPAYSGGDGTKDNPWLISSVEDLQMLAETLNSGKASEIDADADTGDEGVAGNYYGYYFRQTCALDLSGIESWDPIGYNGECYFAGNYDGGGYSISNMKSTGKTDADGYATAGLFGWVAFGSVSNVHIKGANLKATGVGNYSYAGGIAGVVYGSDITNCSVSSSTIESARNSNNNCAGGIAGYSTGGTFNKCAAEGNTVKTMAYGGGFVGEIDDDYGADESSFTDCYVAKSTVTSFTEEVQGLSFAGEFAGEATASALNLNNCFVYENTAEIGEGSKPTLKKTGVFAGNLWQNATVPPLNLEKCYYYTTAKTPANTGDAEEKNKEEFADGTVNNLLGKAFIQGTEHPVLAFVYPVKLETDGGMITEGNVVESYTRGVGATLPTANDITRKGYTFEGWYESSDFSGEAVTAISATDTGDKTYYAKWTRLYTVTVTAESGGTVSGGGTFEDGSTATVTATANSGYRFVRWTENGTEVSTSASYSFTLTADRSLTAVFDRNSSGDGGGGISYDYYTITATAGEGGSISPSGSTRVREGRDQTYTITPDDGYCISDVRVDGVSVGAVSSYTFDNVQKRHTIEAIFAKENPDTGTPFTDVKPDDWFYDDVMYVLENGLMVGTSDTTFEPGIELTRAMAVQILYNLEGQPDISGENLGYPYEDVNAEEWYGNAVYWARITGVATGYGDGTFQPTDSITRQEFAQMLYNYAKYKGYDLTAEGDLSQFPDSESVADWAEAAMSWANGNELINGHDDGTIDAAGIGTRAQAASILMRFDQNLVEM